MISSKLNVSLNSIFEGISDLNNNIISFNAQADLKCLKVANNADILGEQFLNPGMI